MQLDEPVKLEMCNLLEHLCDSQLRHRVESIINFSDDFVAECQAVRTSNYKYKTIMKIIDMLYV